jgi:L-seryl-tRNA(Ser) seleniumtransferase
MLASSAELASLPDRIRVSAARRVIEAAREQILKGIAVDVEVLAMRAAEVGREMSGQNLRACINMTGVILHTGLGRARLAPSAVQAVERAAASHLGVEFDFEEGARGNRQDHVRGALKELTGAEDALVVNNAAGAIVLALSALASGRDVLLSRGQMVEIGGSFRIPEIVKASGARLVEVGCTNKTHLSDYRISRQTAAVLVCHRSNFELSGFVSEPTVGELTQLGVPVIDDMGTGCLVDTSAFGLPRTRTFQDSVAEGAAVSIGSGDKLLGGPQAGIIVGNKEVVSMLSRHPLARAMRVDKLTLAALAATLQLYLAGREREVPTIKYLSRSIEEVKDMAERLAAQIEGEMIIEISEFEVGGGAGSGMRGPSYRVGIVCESPADLARSLRLQSPSVIGRIESDVLWLDPRCVEDDELATAARVINQCLQ